MAAPLTPISTAENARLGEEVHTDTHAETHTRTPQIHMRVKVCHEGGEPLLKWLQVFQLLGLWLEAFIGFGVWPRGLQDEGLEA